MDGNDIEMALDEFDLNSDLSDFECSESEYVPSSIDSEDSAIDFEEIVPQNSHSLVSELSETVVDPVDIPQDNDQPQKNNLPVFQRPFDVVHEWGNCTETVRQFPFIGESGIQINLNAFDPMAIYEQFLTDKVVDLIVTQTIRFAELFLSKNKVGRRSLMYGWQNCDRNEMRHFLDIVMLMGMCPLPNMRLCWSNKEMFKNDVIKRAMSRNRFECILKCLHFNDNNIVDTSEPWLSKIKELSNLLNTCFESVYIPGDNIVIDESMIPWRGRLVFRQYNSQKSHKYGIKLYKICTTFGYTQFKIYAGKSDSMPNVGHAQKVVLHLMSDLVNSGRTLYCNNFYNSVPLDKELYIYIYVHINTFTLYMLISFYTGTVCILCIYIYKLLLTMYEDRFKRCLLFFFCSYHSCSRVL